LESFREIGKKIEERRKTPAKTPDKFEKHPRFAK
jgi:hypothetical protein